MPFFQTLATNEITMRNRYIGIARVHCATNCDDQINSDVMLHVDRLAVMLRNFAFN